MLRTALPRSARPEAPPRASLHGLGLGLALSLAFGPGCAAGDKAGDSAASDAGAGDGAADGGGADGGEGGGDGGGGIGQGYAFASRFDGEDSVNYDGQVFRHLLIEDMKSWIGGVTGRVDSGWFPVSGEVEAELLFYYAFDSGSGGSVPIGKITDPAALQATYNDVSTDKDLVGKMAGNDAVGQHKDWATDMVGWGAPGSTSPDGLARAWIRQIDAAAVARSNGDIPLDPTGAPLSSVYLTPEGHDLQQLLQKFITGAVAFSQGADDYLDDDLEGKGLNSDHSGPDGDSNYTALEHQWDEGFGYFGAARDYGEWSDSLTAEAGVRDSWAPDGAIDLLTEASWGHSVNAAKRDLGAPVATDLSADAWGHFLEGRRLLAESGGPLSEEQAAALRAHRDGALLAWESAIAATVIHYINDVLRDMGGFGGDAYDFAAHAKHWSELKGFALSLQFNPHSPLSDDDFAAFHALVGDAPVLPTAGEAAAADYAARLVEARALLGGAYGFDAGNLGDAEGNHGW